MGQCVSHEDSTSCRPLLCENWIAWKWTVCQKSMVHRTMYRLNGFHSILGWLEAIFAFVKSTQMVYLCLNSWLWLAWTVDHKTINIYLNECGINSEILIRDRGAELICLLSHCPIVQLFSKINVEISYIYIYERCSMFIVHCSAQSWYIYSLLISAFAHACAWDCNIYRSRAIWCYEQYLVVQYDLISVKMEQIQSCDKSARLTLLSIDLSFH